MTGVHRVFIVVVAGLMIGVVSRLLYVNWYAWRLLLDSISPSDYSIGGLVSGLLAWFNPGLSWALAGIAASYECGEGFLGDSPVHELAWYLPYYAASLALALLVKKAVTTRWHPAPRRL